MSSGNTRKKDSGENLSCIRVVSNSLVSDFEITQFEGSVLRKLP